MTMRINPNNNPTTKGSTADRKGRIAKWERKPPPDSTSAMWRTNMQAALARRYAERMGIVLGTISRILSPQVDNVHLVDQPGSPPAWTDGKTIWLNKAMLPELTDPSPAKIAAWLGACYHEMGHTLYSPRADSPLMQKIKVNETVMPNLARVHNVVDDQRQERLLIAQFGPLKVYLTAVAVALILGQLEDMEDPDDMANAWPLLAGRTWLDRDVRIAARNAYRRRGGHPQVVTDLVGRYQRLGDPGVRDADEAFDILVDLSRELAKGMDDLPNMRGCGGVKPQVIVYGDDTPAIADDDDVPSAGSEGDDSDSDDGDDGVSRLTDDDTNADGDGDGDGENGDGEDSDAGSGDKGEGDAEDGDGDGDGEGDGPGSDPGKDQGKGKGDDSQDTTTTTANGKGAGKGGKRPPRPGSVKSATRLLAKQVEVDVRFDPSTVKEVSDTIKAISATGSHGITLDPSMFTWTTTPEADRTTARALGQHFRLFTDRALPYWDRRVSSGKLNVKRYLTNQVPDFDTMFDRFEMGMQDDLSLDVTILIDLSSSMASRIPTPQITAGPAMTQIQAACLTAWVIEQAVHEAEGECTVLGFNQSGWTISPTGTVPHPEKFRLVGASGGTDPSEALRQTADRLASVEAAHKLVVIVTDGDWFGGHTAVEELNQAGVVTIGVMLRGDAGLESPQTISRNEGLLTKMRVQYGIRAVSAADLLPLFEDLVLTRMVQVMGE